MNIRDSSGKKSIHTNGKNEKAAKPTDHLSNLTYPKGRISATIGQSSITSLLYNEPISSAQRQAIALQIGKTQGNHYLQRIIAEDQHTRKIAKASDVRIIQKWDAREHERLGNDATKSHKVQLADDYWITYGEMVALAGDHFESIAQMREFAKKKSGPESRAEIEYAIAWKLKQSERAYDDDKAKESQESRYYKLAGKNQSHFLNPSVGDKEQPIEERNKEWNFTAGSGSFPTAGTPANAGTGYRSNHWEAIEEAVRAAENEEGPNSALAREAFGTHYLTDAFAGGHIRTERKSIKEHWDKRVPMFNYNFKGYLAQKLTAELQKAEYTYGPVTVRQDVLYAPPPWLTVFTGPGALEKITSAIDAKGSFTFGDVLSGAIHDKDNVEGVFVEVYFNNIHYLMRMKGDESLGDEQEVLLKEIVKASYDEILLAHSMATEGKMLPEVLDILMPNGVFMGEVAMPKPLSDQWQDNTPSIKYDYDSVEELLGDARIVSALAIFAEEKAGELLKAAEEIGENEAKAMKTAIVNRLVSDPATVLKEIINWTPDTGGGLWEHNTDDNANDYWQQAKNTPGGLKSLTYTQRKRLIGDLLSGATVGDDEDAIMDVLKNAPEADARQLIQHFGWSKLYDDIDDWVGTEFEDRFPRNKYD